MKIPAVVEQVVALVDDLQHPGQFEHSPARGVVDGF